MADDMKTIRVSPEAFDAARERKEQAGQTWAEYLTDENRGRADPDDVATQLTAKLNIDADDAHDELDDLADRVEALNDAVDASDFGGMDYDDAVAACRQAIREELPVEAMGR